MFVRLFSVCAVVPIYITLLGGAQISRHVPRLFILLAFLSFSLVDSLYCWCERNTGRHFIGFYYHKNKRDGIRTQG